MSVNENMPLTREYLQSLKKSDEELVKTMLHSDLQVLRETVIRAAGNGSIGIGYRLTVSNVLLKNLDRVRAILDNNFPGCDITLRDDGWVDINWYEPINTTVDGAITSEVEKEETQCQQMTYLQVVGGALGGVKCHLDSNCIVQFLT